MPYRRRRNAQATYFHVVNRSVRKAAIFLRPGDYRAFQQVLREGLEMYPVELLAYCILSNHWHLLVRPSGSKVLSDFMRWVSATHAIRWHVSHQSRGQGPVYQGRFTAVPLEASGELVTVCRYVERNALSAGLVKHAEDWPWCSLADRLQDHSAVPLVSTPFLTSDTWVAYVNAVLTTREYVRAATSAPSGVRSVEKTSEVVLAKTVEKTSEVLGAPLDHVPGHPRAVERAHQIGRVRRRGDKQQADPHIESAEHLGIINAAGLLQPAKQRRHAPAAPVEVE